ncbi:MAG: CotH kinase family protein, partial [Verrucomicrobiales bacterium]
GEPNGTNQGLPSAPVTFSTPGRGFTGSLSLTLTSDSPSAEIRYTTDGRLPTNSSTRFIGTPISVTSSTLIRARVFETGKAPGPISEEAYIRLASNVSNFNSDLPVVVLDRIGNNESGSNGKASVFWAIFEPGAIGGRTRLLGEYTLGTCAGYQVRGSSSTGFAKQSWAIEAWDETNSNKNIRPLGMPNESDWILSGRYTFDRALMRNPFIYELSNQIGRYAVRTRFVEVYLNTNGGDLQSSDYHGVYTLMEKISRDADRVDVERLPEGVTTEPGITGGYILKIDRADPGDNGFTGAGQALRYVYPKEENVTVAQGNWIRDYTNAFGDALNGANFGDPLLGYEPFIDVDAFIDHHLLNVLTLNADALRLSTYMFKPRDGKLQMGPIWDFDRAMGSTDGRDANPSTWQGGTNYFTYPWWNRLFADENFWQRYIDRYTDLRQGAFSTSNIHGIIDGFAADLQESQVRNFQRWTGVPPRFGGYQGEVNHLKDWLETRVEWMDDQFLTSPRTDKSPGMLNAGEQVRLSSPSLSAGREIRYTLDGSDPRSQITPLVVEGTTLLDENAP